MLNPEDKKVEDKEEVMPKKSYATSCKRIYNPTTKTSYRIRQRSSNKGARGTIMGKWKPQIETKKKKRKK